jgi:glycerophosphoryl diester phosphodiesterase
MDTIKLTNKGSTKMVAHRGLSKLERENTMPAFVAAGNRSYYGIETDIHITLDGRFIVYHDDNTLRLTGVDIVVENTDFDTLRGLKITDLDEQTRIDLHMPTLEEYLKTCKKYGKIAVLELKNPMPKDKVLEVCDVLDAMEYRDGVVHISFNYDNLLYVKEKYPTQKVQFLCKTYDEELIQKLKKDGMDLDIHRGAVDKNLVDLCHNNGIEINVWTVDDPEQAQSFLDLGVDYITTNILE